jgi:hypothetical protein
MLTRSLSSKFLLIASSFLLLTVAQSRAQSAQAPAAPPPETAAKPAPPPKPKPVNTEKAAKPKPAQSPANTTQKPPPVNTTSATAPAQEHPAQTPAQNHSTNNNANPNNQVTMNPLGANNLLNGLQRTPPVFYQANPGPAPANNGAAVNNAANSLENAAGNAFAAATTTLATAGTAVANTAASTLNGANNAAAHYSNSRGILPNQGQGDFRQEDYTLTAYSCYRSGSRLLCDFDVSKAAAAEATTNAFSNVAIVDDGGKITHRSDAYFMGSDGARLPSAYLSGTPVRYIMEFNDPTQSASVSLICGDERIQNVPVNVSASH